MIYTNYFSLVIKRNGALNLSQDQMQRFMNIVYLEAVIETYEGLSLNSPRIFQEINAKKSKLDRLTKKYSPEELLKEIHTLSE